MWVLEGSRRGVYVYGKLPEFYNGKSSTAAGLSLCQYPEQPDVSQLSVVEFRCGKVENLGGRGVRVKRGGRICVGAYMTSMTS